MRHELISIIMPFRNTANYLPDCLNSILEQEEKNWELLAVDDFSEDNSFAILKDYQNRDFRIKVFKNKERGIIGALNTAYEHVQGEFVTRMDSDDLMTPNKLTVFKKSLLQSGSQHLAVGTVKYFGEHEIGDGYSKYEQWLNHLTAKGNNLDEIYKECVIPSPAWMCYRNDFEACGGFNSPFYPEDYDLTFRFYQMGLKCIPCASIVHLWRDYPSRTSRTHPNYANNTFLVLKFRYFMLLDYQKNKKVLLWGAGTKGKHLAKMFLTQKIPFTWVCENPNKLGKKIYEVSLLPLQEIKNWEAYQSIVTVANPKEQENIKALFSNLSLKPLKHYFFFC